MGYQREYFPVMTADDLMIFHSDGYNYKIKDYVFRFSDKNVNVDIIKDDFPNMEFILDNVDNSVVVEFPRIFYFGYELMNEDGKLIKLNSNEYGMLEAIVTKNGKYELSYVKSKIHRISEFISLLTILVVMGFLVVKYIKWKRKMHRQRLL